MISGDGGLTHQDQTPGPLARVGQWVAGLVALAALVVSVLLAYLIVGSLTSPPERDPHGYALIFGSIFLVPTALVGALVLPFAARRDQPRARRWAIGGAVVWVAAALALAAFALLSG